MGLHKWGFESFVANLLIKSISVTKQGAFILCGSILVGATAEKKDPPLWRLGKKHGFPYIGFVCLIHR